MKKPKVLFVLHLPPPVHGAAMVGAQIKKSTAVKKAFDCRFVDLGLSKDIDTIGKQPLKKLWSYILMLSMVFKQLRRFKPDLCYMTPTAKGIGLYKDFPVILLVKCFKVQIVYHFHNKGVSEKQNQLCDHYAYKWMFKNAKVILLSKYLYDDIKKYVSPVRVFYCPNGIPEYGIENINLKKTKKKEVQILFLSNLMVSKGVFVLLAACKILNQKQIPFHCTFVGGEGDISVKQFQNMVMKQELTEHVVYKGRKYGNAKNTEFEKADIFVLPTYNETFGLVNLEAMQFALPVVSTYEGGIPEIVEDGVTGFLVPQKDAQALADKLEVLIKNPQLRTEMGHAGRLKYENHYTLRHFEKRFVDCLKDIANV